MGALRYLVGQRAYLVLSLATLALSVGANLVVFSIANALWLRPRPVKDPARVVMVMGDTRSSGSAETMSFAEIGLQRQVRDVPAFARVAGQVMTSGFNAALTPKIVLDPIGHPLETLGVTSEYFGVLGLPIRGRDFTRDDDRDGAQPVAIISERVWQDGFGGRDDVIGRLIPAVPVPIQIIGIAPPEFHGARLGEQADLWIPRNLVPRVATAASHGAPVLPEDSVPVLALARLQPWVSVAGAQRAVDARAREQHFTLSRLSVVPLAQIFGAPNHRTLLINEGPVLRVIGATALLVLAGGCATLMALVLVHYERRRQEFAIRLAIGASRARLLRQLAGELGWLIAGGCAAACGLAWWAIRALPALSLPGGVDLGRLDLSLDWRLGLAGLAATAVAVSAAAALPLARFTRDRLAGGLVTPGATAAASSLRLRKAMLAVHVAATVMVLVAASLFIRTVQYGFTRGAGFDVDRTLFVNVDVGSVWDLSAHVATERARGGTPTTGVDVSARRSRISAELAVERRAASRRVTDSLATLPGVEALAVGPIPVGPDRTADIVRPKFIETRAGRRDLRAGLIFAGPEYASALGLRTLAGRALTRADARPYDQPAPALVTASLASTLWPGRSPLGQYLRMGFSSPAVEYDIVGVVQDFAYGSMRFDPPAAILRVIPDPSATTLELVIKARDPDALVEPVRRLIAGILPNAPRLSIATGPEVIAADLGRERLGAWFFSGFGIVALGLGLGGVFGLIAYLAESRRRELGVRMALGAAPADLLRLALGAGLVPTTIGVTAGLVLATILTRAAEGFLIGVSRLDWLSYASAASLMLASAMAAGLAAAWRVRRIAPVEALRAE